MNLDDLSTFKRIDQSDMLGQITSLPDQLAAAWDHGQSLELPEWTDIERVVIAGMGGSAIGADLLSSYIAPLCRIPVQVHRDYLLPGWAAGSQTLVICSSHSGNTEETLSAFQQAQENRSRCLVVSTGGKLAELAASSGLPLWQFEHDGQPRAAVGFSFGLLLAVFARLGLIPDPADELGAAVSGMRRQQQALDVQLPVVENPAKRLAGQMVERWVTVVGSGILAPVARRWKGQISEIAKAWAQFEFLPELDHNTLAGVENPQQMLSNQLVLFLRSTTNHQRNALRSDLTRNIFMLQGLGTDYIDAAGETRMEQQWTCLHFGDYTAYYLAMVYGVDPTPVEAIEGLKRELKAASALSNINP